MLDQEALQTSVLFPQSSHFREGRLRDRKFTIGFVQVGVPSVFRQSLDAKIIAHSRVWPAVDVGHEQLKLERRYVIAVSVDQSYCTADNVTAEKSPTLASGPRAVAICSDVLSNSPFRPWQQCRRSIACHAIVPIPEPCLPHLDVGGVKRRIVVAEHFEFIFTPMFRL